MTARDTQAPPALGPAGEQMLSELHRANALALTRLATLLLGDQELLAAVARLPRRAREVLALRYYLDLTDIEISATLGISRGTVSSTASRGLAALARELKEEL